MQEVTHSFFTGHYQAQKCELFVTRRGVLFGLKDGIKLIASPEGRAPMTWMWFGLSCNIEMIGAT